MKCLMQEAASVYFAKRSEDRDHFLYCLAVGCDRTVIVEGFAENAYAVIFLLEGARKEKVTVIRQLCKGLFVKLLFANLKELCVVRKAKLRLLGKCLAKIGIILIHTGKLQAEIAEVKIDAVTDVAGGVEFLSDLAFFLCRMA